MTFTQYAQNFLTDHALFPDEAEKVITLTKEDKANEAIASRWDEAIEGYPAGIATHLCITLAENAIKYIEAENPRHWTKLVFQKILNPTTTETPK
jgi:hypothetical protein